MDIETCLQYLSTRGVEFAEFLYRHAKTPRAKDIFAERFGINPTRMGQYIRFSIHFFEPCPDEGLRQQAIEIARKGAISIDMLVMINAKVRKLDNPDRREAFRVELHKYATNHAYSLVKQHAAARITEINEATPIRDNRSLRYVRFSHGADENGMGYMMAKLPQEDLARLQKQLVDVARHYENSTVSNQQALADALMACTTAPLGSTETPTGREGLILLPADGYKHIGDQWLATTDGARIHATELAEQLLTEYGYALLYDENAEPVDLFRTKRFANSKQRLILTADQLLCVDPTCTRLAYRGEAHHLQAWSRGGETNLENLVMACGTHNSQNDDDPNRHRNGFYLRDPQTGRASWQPPDPDMPLQHNQHLLAAKSGRNWALRHFRGEKSEICGTAMPPYVQ